MHSYENIPEGWKETQSNSFIAMQKPLKEVLRRYKGIFR